VKDARTCPEISTLSNTFWPDLFLRTAPIDDTLSSSLSRSVNTDKSICATAELEPWW
jgi:hypothetical protein